MKKLITVAFLLCAFPFVSSGAGTLKLQMTIITGEHGRDSHSVRTTITVSDKTVVYQVTYTGRLKSRAPERKEFKLENKDRKTIIKLIKDRNLLVTKSLERDQESKGTYSYFELVFASDLNGTKGLISIKGPRNAVDMKEMELFKNSVALIEEIYLVMDSADNRMTFEPLIN